MTAVLGCGGIWHRRWQGAAAVCAVAMVASCGMAGVHGGPGRNTAAAAGPSGTAVGSPPPSPVLGYQLNGVAAVSATSAWVVGTTNRLTPHVIRWDGRAWQRVPVPGAGYLNGVAAISAADAWAVGAGTGNTALIEHWNGMAWTPVAAPSTGGPAILHAVAAVSPRDVWAVGGTNFTGQTVILRWNGTAWARVSSPTPPGRSSELDGVTATSAANAWAVGYTFTKTGKMIPLIEHWNGTAWWQVPSPALPAGGVLRGVAAASVKNAWAVGSSKGALVERWNGTAWTVVHRPALAMGALGGVTALSGASAWAVGMNLDRSQGQRTVIERWNGKSWALVPSPAVGSLAGVTATSTRNAWAVGSFTGSATGIIEHWDGSSWTCVSVPSTAGPCPPG